MEKVLEMIIRSQQKSINQAARESRLTRHAILSVLPKELSYGPWNPHYVQELRPEDCDRTMEYGQLMLSWHGIYREI